MLVHTVLFRLKDDLTEDQIQKFRAGLENLRSIVYVKAVYVGTPAETGDRPQIDKSYTVGMTAVFNNMKDHDSYQTHPKHKKFLSDFNTYWTDIRIYDFG